MKNSKVFHPMYMVLIALLACQRGPVDWQLTGFEKRNDLNPILEPDTSSLFEDPISKKVVRWEGKDVFNPASVVYQDTLFLLYRAEDFVGRHNGTSRLGLAYSLDGLHFTRVEQPVFYPQEDWVKKYEWEGGAEDPRVVVDEKGRFVMTYTAYDGDIARLMVATSRDLRSWRKHGPAFTDIRDKNTWSKSGSIVSTRLENQLVATKLNSSYWMYFGDTDLFIASSDDLVQWNIVKNPDGSWKKVLSPRPGMFDSDLVEPGPPALLTKQGILLIYNSRNSLQAGDEHLPDGTYAAGQVLMDASDPTIVLSRASNYFFYPTEPYEMTGQVNNVCFVEGLSYFRGKWFLYYGTADSKIAVAVSEAPLP